MKKHFGAVLLALLLGLAALAPSYVGVDTNSAQTISNKTLDTTNIYQGRYWQPQLGTALCIVGAGYSLWDLPSTTNTMPTATCAVGTNTLKATLDYASSQDQSAQMTLRMPYHDPNGRGGYDNSGSATVLELLWYSTTTSGNVVWQVSTSCVAPSATATDDPAFNTANSITSAVPGTANRIQTATITSLTMTGCSPGYVFHLKVRRQAGSGSDTMAGTAKLLLVTLAVPRT